MLLNLRLACKVEKVTKQGREDELVKGWMAHQVWWNAGEYVVGTVIPLRLVLLRRSLVSMERDFSCEKYRVRVSGRSKMYVLVEMRRLQRVS